MKYFVTIIIMAAVLMSFGCGGSAGQGTGNLMGAGATFPQPLYDKMFYAYYQQYGIEINYQGIGSGGGQRQLLSKTVDFGGTDAFMSDSQLAEAPAKIVHIPTCLGAVAVTYNLPGNPQLKFTSDVLADIFLGTITKWNDPRIVEINAEVSLPDRDIVVAHRSDGSGTTAIFSDYLAKVSSTWQEKVGAGKSLNWPVGLGAKGNPGVAGLIKQNTGYIGYVELIYALTNDMQVAKIKNASGNFVAPSLASTSKAANVEIPDDTRISITDTAAAEGYSIAGFTWIIVYKEQNYDNRPQAKAEELVKLLWWMTHEGQKHCQPLHYAPLPEAAAKKAETIIRSITYADKPVME